MRALDVAVQTKTRDPILAPVGTFTSQVKVADLRVTGGRILSVAIDADVELSAALIEPVGSSVTLHYDLIENQGGHYPEASFRVRDTPHTRAANDLACASRDIALTAGGGRAGIEALIAEAEARFSYGHPEKRFTDEKDAVPYLSCGLTEGPCVDINTYLVASLRSAGYDAAYFYGYFFPKERDGMTDDGHCWVVTRNSDEILEWDIAHHIKAGLGPTRASLNPRPGERVAVTHSMGHRYNIAGRQIDIKILGEPLQIPASGQPIDVSLTAHLSRVAPKQPRKIEGE
ncbi:Transglutaminase-like superfamily protein [Octadecabacter temperatus]|uniref:Uncharacterized protein n=1 Tax=Octadecabacter temperatus TaxID=1458307 RepID=A0A0K0Y805_9RHOB|nr:transglutaminase domain-containing protein [Octadecabacter temperatus]AKS47045.1 hypothetical protein OSB_25140 [Octadecabacter temperatus]SIO47084.1 Transglutaminase-like superfamily protein [Octadecabacter temperatus]